MPKRYETQYLSGVNWWEYVERVAGTSKLVEIQERTGIQGPTLSRWRAQKQGVDARTAAQFARAYGRPVIEAFIAAGFLTAEEANVQVVAGPSLDDLTADELIAQLQKVLWKAAKEGATHDIHEVPSMAALEAVEGRAARTGQPNLRDLRTDTAGEENQDPDGAVGDDA